MTYPHALPALQPRHPTLDLRETGAETSHQKLVVNLTEPNYPVVGIVLSNTEFTPLHINARPTLTFDKPAILNLNLAIQFAGQTIVPGIAPITQMSLVSKAVWLLYRLKAIDFWAMSNELVEAKNALSPEHLQALSIPSRFLQLAQDSKEDWQSVKRPNKQLVQDQISLVNRMCTYWLHITSQSQ